MLQFPTPDGKRFYSRKGKLFFLQRKGDEGQSAYINTLYASFAGEQVSPYDHRQPSGSRADLRAKGHWQHGRWTIEFRRRLNTGHNDDLQFSTDRHYFFGLSRYEIAGRAADPALDQPLHGSGDTGPLIQLSFTR